jgi:hypothetical protein
MTSVVWSERRVRVGGKKERAKHEILNEPIWPVNLKRGLLFSNLKTSPFECVE